MAQHERSQFKAGLFIILSIALIFVVTIALKGIHTVFTPVDQRKVRFTLQDDIGGLRVGDEVRIGGFKVGVVQSINLEGLGQGQTPGLVVTFSVPRAYPLYANAHIAIETVVTGTSVLNIDDIGSGEVLTDNLELTGHPSALTALEDTFAGSGTDLHDIIHQVKTDTIPKASTAMDSISGAGTQISGYLSDTKTDFRTTVANLNSITTNANAKLPGILDHVDAFVKQVSTALDSSQGTLTDLKATVANTKDLTAGARDIVTGNRGKIDNIINGLKSTSDSLKGAAADLRRSPWRLLYHPGPGEMDNLELYDAARQFADGANNMNDAALALRDSLNNPNVDKAKVQKLMDQLNTSYSNFNVVEDKLWKGVRQ